MDLVEADRLGPGYRDSFPAASIADKILHSNMFNCVPQEQRESYLHILTVGATNLAQDTFGFPRIAVKSSNLESLSDHLSSLWSSSPSNLCHGQH